MPGKGLSRAGPVGSLRGGPREQSGHLEPGVALVLWGRKEEPGVGSCR